MATQGVLSVTVDGRVVAKLVTGSDGYQLPKLARIVREKWLTDIIGIYVEAKQLKVGSMGSLYVFDANGNYVTNADDELPDKYLETFTFPQNNPRWDRGTEEYTEVVELGAGEGQKT